MVYSRFTGGHSTSHFSAYRTRTQIHLAVGQNQWYHVGVGAPPISGPILVVGLGCSLGVRALAFDPWPFEATLVDEPGSPSCEPRAASREPRGHGLGSSSGG